MKWLGMALAGLMLLGLVGCKKKPPEETTIFPSEPITTPAPAPTPTAAAPAEAAKMVYTCSMHPDVEQAEPGECPQCKMLLHAKVPEGTKVEYYCPSHPDVVQGEPGKCSQCGMFLHARVKEGAAVPAPSGEVAAPPAPGTT